MDMVMDFILTTLIRISLDGLNQLTHQLASTSGSYFIAPIEASSTKTQLLEIPREYDSQGKSTEVIFGSEKTS